MEELLNALCTKSLKNVIEKKKEEFVETPLKDWLAKLKSSREEATVQDVESVEAFLELFKTEQGTENIDTADIRKFSSKVEGILKEIKHPPNNLQFAIAQAAYSLLG